MRTSQGLPLTMLILGVWSRHNLERIHEDIARITSGNVDPGGLIDTQLGKEPWGHCKDYLWQCWSRGSIDTQLWKDPWGHCKDYLWQCWSWGVNWHTTWKGSMRTLQGLPLTMLIGGWLTHNLERICEDIAWITSDNVDPGGQSTHNLERIHEDIARITSDNVDPGRLIDTGQLGKDPWGHHKDYLWQCWSWEVDRHTTWKGSMRISQGLPLTMLILGGWLTHNLERICEDIARITSDNVDPGGWLAHNLERIHEDIARITSDNVDPGGSIDTQLGKNLCGHCKDYLWQCLSWGLDWHTTWKGSMRTSQGLPLTMLILGVDWHTTWKGSMKTSQGLPLTMLILGVNKHTTWKGSMRTLQGLPVTMLILGFDWNTT